MATMKAVRVPGAGKDFEVFEADRPRPGRGQVLLRVEACGLCHSDAFVKEGGFPGLEYPRVPGHEVVGVIEQVGDGVERWERGQRVGVGWHGGHCWGCGACRDGDFVLCEKQEVTGISYDGGYAEWMVAPVEALARVPDGMDPAIAAPLLCAGVTTYNALRHSGARPGDVVAVQGIGGLGHLGIQYARAMGFYTVAISHSADKEALARELGAKEFIATKNTDAAEALQALGGARVILATAPNPKAMSKLVDGLGRNGTLVVVGASAEALEVSPFQLIMARKRIQGWPSGTAKDSEETLQFSADQGIEPMIEKRPLAEAAAAYQRMMSNEARFRMVLTTAHAR